MNFRDQDGKVEAISRDRSARKDVKLAEWSNGIVRLGGTGDFAGVSDPILRSSYLDSARSLLHGNQDRLSQFALPILFLQRHALELGLKSAIQTVAHYHHVACRCPGPEPEAPRHHNLKKLLRRFEEWLRPDANDETMVLMHRLVQRLHKLDADGTWARYRDTTSPVHLYLGTTQCELDDLFERLFANPTDINVPVGWIVEYAYLTDELVRNAEVSNNSETT